MQKAISSWFCGLSLYFAIILARYYHDFVGWQAVLHETNDCIFLGRCNSSRIIVRALDLFRLNYDRGLFNKYDRLLFDKATTATTVQFISIRQPFSVHLSYKETDRSRAQRDEQKQALSKRSQESFTCTVTIFL